jgi:DNA invertase Pin-like site-specific DNA recombinase
MATRIYVRVSSLKQREASQLPDLKKWVEDHPNEAVIWYRDEFTGKTLRRPGRSKLQGDLRRGDRVLVWKSDRLGRKAHEALALAEDSEKAGITFESRTERLDFTTPPGKSGAGSRLGIRAAREPHRARPGRPRCRQGPRCQVRTPQGDRQASQSLARTLPDRPRRCRSSTNA